MRKYDGPELTKAERFYMNHLTEKEMKIKQCKYKKVSEAQQKID